VRELHPVSSPLRLSFSLSCSFPFSSSHPLTGFPDIYMLGFWNGCAPRCLSLNSQTNKLDHIRIKILPASLHTRSYSHFFRETFRHHSSKKRISPPVVQYGSCVSSILKLFSDARWRTKSNLIIQTTPGITFCAREEAVKGRTVQRTQTVGITHFVSGRENAAAFLVFRGYGARSHLGISSSLFTFTSPFSEAREVGPSLWGAHS